jgi:hydroxymethylpyrimidine pyrophosphatase-like HAD family hydrolase
MLTTLFVFDADGTVTDLQSKTVVNSDVFKILSAILAHSDILAFNTGRSVRWMTERVYDPFLATASPKLTPDELQKIVIVGEKGASWLISGENGEQQVFSDKSLALPEKVAREIRKLVLKYSESMFLDPTKEVILSVEMKDGLDLDLYAQKQQQLIPEIREILISANLDQTFRIVPNRIAVDIENITLGKKSGARRIMELISQTGNKYQTVIASGDGITDLESGQFFWDKIMPVKFVFVGNRSQLDNRRTPFPVIITKSQNDSGFVEYFQRFITKV